MNARYLWIVGAWALAASSAAAGSVPHTVEHKMDNYTTVFQVVSPEGAACHVKSDNEHFGEEDFEVPFKFDAQASFYYTFDCKLPDGQVWHQKLEPKANVTNIIRIGATAPAAAPAAASVKSEGPKKAMAPAAFAKLVEQITKASFQKDKISVMELAAKANHFTVEQVGKLVDVFDFSDGKVKVVSLTSQRLVDPDNRFELLSHFEFSADKDKAKTILDKSAK